MAVMSVTIPIVLGLVVAGGESSRQAERETRAVMTARSVFEELRRAENGSSELLQRADLPWVGTDPNDPGAGEAWLIFEVSSEGRLLSLASDMEYEGSWTGPSSEVTTIAAVRGLPTVMEGAFLPDGSPLSVFQLEVRVESPARAIARDRQREIFYRSQQPR